MKKIISKIRQYFAYKKILKIPNREVILEEVLRDIEEIKIKIQEEKRIDLLNDITYGLEEIKYIKSLKIIINSPCTHEKRILNAKYLGFEEKIIEINRIHTIRNKLAIV